MDEKLVRTCKQRANVEGWGLHVGPPDPEHGRTGGVGIQSRSPIKAVPIIAATKVYEDAHKTVSVVIYSFDLAAVILHIVIIYGGRV